MKLTKRQCKEACRVYARKHGLHTWTVEQVTILRNKAHAEYRKLLTSDKGE